jgi:hypothetical protein
MLEDYSMSVMITDEMAAEQLPGVQSTFFTGEVAGENGKYSFTPCKSAQFILKFP